ncbi:MAG TPA: AraC family transcriptional regulator [Planctomycetota bacterium]|nr:AraC family transcriptional regulator [Planctomycetota bacterium]
MPAIGLIGFSSRHAPGFAMAPTTHGFAKLLLVVDGGGAIERDGASHALAAGDVLWIADGCAHRLVDDARRPLAVLGLCLDPAALVGVVGRAWRAAAAAIGASPRALPDAYRRSQVERGLRLIIAEQAEDRLGRDAAVWSHALGVAGELVRASRGSRQRSGDDGFAASLAWLAEHFREPVTVTRLARISGLSYRGWTARFTAATGSHVGAHLARLRVEHACRLLATGTPVIDAALSAGYADLSHFYRQFGRLTGTTPARWARKRLAAR